MTTASLTMRRLYTGMIGLAILCPIQASSADQPKDGEKGFVSLFNGKDLTGWIGDIKGYVIEDQKILCKPGGNLYTKNEYSDFVFRFEFKLTAGANNGLGIRTPTKGDAAYVGMELQILDDSAERYKKAIGS